MQQMLLIVMVEVLVLALIASILLLSLNWRRKKRRHASVDQLVDDIKDGQGARKQKLLGKLNREFKLDKQTSQNLSEVLMIAEKQFLQQFIEQEMGESVSGFYENLSALLESYMQVMVQCVGDAGRLTQSPPSPRPEVNADQNSLETAAPVLSDPPPDWGDVFD